MPAQRTRGALVFFAVFLGPTLLRINLSGSAKAGLLGAAAVIVAYALVLTVIPEKIWTPFAAKWTVPKIGWFGVFGITIVLDFLAALLAFFVLRRMKAPALAEEPVTAPQPAAASAARA